MSGSTASSFGTAPVGSSVLPCPLGIIEVVVIGVDGAPVAGSVNVKLTGPDALVGVAPGDGTPWRSPKVRPGDYRVEVDPGSLPKGWQAPTAATCRLPTSGTATARLVLHPTATLPIRVVRRGTDRAIADVTVLLSQTAATVTGVTSADGDCRLAELVTTRGSYRMELSLPATVAARYEAWPGRDITVESGPNPRLLVELAPLAELTVSVVDPDATNRRSVAAVVTVTPEGGEGIEVETDEATGAAHFVGLAAGRYEISATPAPDSGFISAAGATVDLERGAEKPVELAATRARSRIVMSDKASREAGRGLLWNLLAKPYPVCRDELAQRFNRNTTILLPFSQLEFDDIYFEPDDAYWDDGREAIAITGWAEFHAVRRQILFAHTYRPNRLLLAVKRKQWSFDKDWIQALAGPFTRHLSMADAFLILSASETSIKSADLPPGVSSFFADEDIDLKQGVNLYGNLDIQGFPRLEQLLTWLGFKESYVKLQGSLGHEANFAISKEAIAQKEVHERAWELALSGTVPWRIPAGLERVIKERELKLEVSGTRETKGHGSTTKTEKKVAVTLEDAITVPLPTLTVPWLVVVNEEHDVEFTGSIEVEHDVADKKHEPKISVEYATDFTMAMFGKNLAVHDFKAKLDFSEDKLTLSGEIDLGRREKVAVVEFARKVGSGKNGPKSDGGGGTGGAPSPGSGPAEEKLPVVPGEKDPATPPKPSVDLTEKMNKPQPEPPTEEELAAASSGAPPSKAPRKPSPWSVTVKLKPSVVMGLVDIVRDLAEYLKQERTAP